MVVAPHGPTPLPPQPQNPATLQDVRHGVTYINSVTASSRIQGGTSGDDVSRAHIHYVALPLEASGGTRAAPAWLGPILDALNVRLDAIDAKCTAMNDTLTEIKANVTINTRASSKLWNQSCGDGSHQPYLVVPFEDGTLPTAAAHGLPPLLSREDVYSLRVGQVNAYLQGYGIDVGPEATLRERRSLIAKAIGDFDP